MNLNFNLFGFTVASVTFELHQAADNAATVVEEGEKLIGRAIKGTSRFWVERMMRR
jgi:hypothetical protein